MERALNRVVRGIARLIKRRGLGDEPDRLFEDDPLLAQRLLYELLHRWKDGTTHVAFGPLELIDRLAALVPPPRFHTVRYHGVLASRSKHRIDVVPEAAAPTSGVTGPHAPACGHRSTSRPSRYYSRSELMRRVFEVDVLLCPRCTASPMRILAAIHPPTTTEAILKSLGLPNRPRSSATTSPVPLPEDPSARREPGLPGPLRPAG